MEFKIIAKIHTDFKEKFGIPRQSGIAEHSIGQIVFEPEYRRDEALRGLAGYSHIWLLWEFSESVREDWSPTVRPPRLGGNKRMGVFATRSPFRPNPIGLSSVRLLSLEKTKDLGTVLNVSGADLMDGTPIYDIKPYLKYTDSHEDATGGFADDVMGKRLDVIISEEYGSVMEETELLTLKKILEGDPRPGYKGEDSKEYGMTFSSYEVFFKVEEKQLTVTRIERTGKCNA